MPLYREDNFLVVHPGSEYTLFLFGLQDSLSPPEYKIPSIVYKNPVSNEFQAKENEDSIEELDKIHPIKGGKIADLEGFKFLLKIILQSIIAKNPIITINQIPLLVISPSLSWSRFEVESITKYVFETLEFSGFNILDLSVASNFGIGGGTNSLVVNVGKDSTQICPVVASQSIKYAGKYLSVGGGLINEELAKLLPNLSEKQIETLKTSNIFEVVNDDESYYSMNDLKEGSDEDVDIAKLVTEEGVKVANGDSKDQEEKPNNQLEKNSFVDPDTQEKITIGKERFQGTAKLVGILAEAIYKSLDRIPDLEKRQDCYNNLILTGSTFKIPGFKHALIKKLYEDYLVRSPSEKAATDNKEVNSAIAAYQQTDDAPDPSEGEYVIAQVPVSIRTAKIPEHFPEWKKPKEWGGSWENVYFLGGQIYAKQIFGGNSNPNGELFVDSDHYTDKGPNAIWNASI